MKIGVMITDSCNFQCRHCMVDSSLKQNLIDDSVLQRFYEIVMDNQPDTVCILGGEPLIFINTVEEIVADDVLEKFYNKKSLANKTLFLITLFHS